MNWRHLVLAAALGALGFVGIGTAPALAAEPLKYQFNGTKEAVYQFTIRAEMPDSVETHTGMISYDIKSVDPANGQIQMSYTSEIHTNTQQKHPDNRPGFPDTAFPPPFSWGAAPQASPDILIGPQGGVIRSNRTDDESQLPHLLGYTWQLLLQPLAEDGAATWKTQRTIALYTKSEQKRWPPPPPWERQADNRVDRSARETITYTLGQPDGSVLPVQRQYDMSTDEKVGDSPVLRQSGQGKFLFDTKAGLIQSLDMKLTIEVNQENIAIKIPVTISARLLPAEEVAKLKTQRTADITAARAQHARDAAVRAENEQGLTQSKKTAEVGGLIGAQGGGPVARAKANTPVIGFRYAMGSWAGEGVLHKFDPLYEKPASKDDEATDELAKDGYVVTGMIVAHAQYPNAVQIIYARLKDGKVDIKDTYRSKWLGVPIGNSRTQLAGKGEMVVGTFGRTGLNINTIGLMVADPDAKPGAVRVEAPAASARAQRVRPPADSGQANEEGTTRTPQLGNPGGGSPYVRMDAERRPVIGARFVVAVWGGIKCVRRMDPLYEKPAEPASAPAIDILAKPGYAMGGLVVNMDNKTKNTYAMQVIFMRLENGKLLKADQYRSPWVSDVNNNMAKLVLNAKGDTVVGFFGRQGLNNDAIGLILKDPNYKPKPAVETEVDAETEQEVPTPEK